MITLTQVDEWSYRVVYENGVYCGDMLRDVDGYFYLWFEDPCNGFHPSHILRQYADWLDYLNEAWDLIIQQQC